MTVKEKAFKRIMRKRENAGDQPFPTVLSNGPSLSSADPVNLTKSKTLLFSEALTLYHTIPTFNDPEEEVL